MLISQINTRESLVLESLAQIRVDFGTRSSFASPGRSYVTLIMGSIEDRVVRSIHERFNALPSKNKPRVFPDGSREWVPLSGIALVRG